MNIQKIGLAFLLFLSANFKLSAQLGCTDPQATNFDLGATINDGSCLYATTFLTPNFETFFPDELEEASGIEYLNGQLWLNVDAGNGDKLFRVNTANGAIEQQIIIANGDNIDWEDLAENENYVYIGDFGNNAGNRMDLRIFRVNKNDFGSPVINADVIEFSYSDQVDFTPAQNNHNYDCESFFYFQDSLHLFSKNWENEQTRHYVLPTDPGTHVAQLQENFDADGLITAADIDAQGNVVLLGHTSTQFTFMWLLYDYPNTQFFAGNKRRIEIGSILNNGQAEGICYTSNGAGYICSEETPDQNAQLQSFSIQDYLLEDEYIYNAPAIEVFPNPFEEELFIKTEEGNFDQVNLIDINGVVQGSFSIHTTFQSIKLNVPPGIYYLQFRNENGTTAFKKVIKLN